MFQCTLFLIKREGKIKKYTVVIENILLEKGGRGGGGNKFKTVIYKNQKNGYIKYVKFRCKNELIKR